MTLPRALHMATRSGWLHDVIRYRRLSAPHFLEPDPGSNEERDLAKTAGLMRAAEEAIKSAELLSRFMMADFHRDDVKWLRDVWRPATSRAATDAPVTVAVSATGPELTGTQAASTRLGTDCGPCRGRPGRCWPWRPRERRRWPAGRPGRPRFRWAPSGLSARS